MAIAAALRRGGMRFVSPLISPEPFTAVRSSLITEEHVTPGVRSISTQSFNALLGDTPNVDVKKNVIVTVSSDKGLCGGINSTTVKVSKAISKLQSVVSFLATMATVLSLEVTKRETECGGKLDDPDSYEIEGGETKGEILQNLTGEQDARMSAVDSSSRNARDMLDRLTLTYNRTRQASITMELTEITSGAATLEG
ncbi:unnamed protein product [Dovyalis caffra]|uniref:ATP synthase subunit gamma n=1 Tax=Dovyalis caffra TaxID=77055 RepID=A0AAV1QZR5_9ROSI|nr:unnamed protein product [Dovyalis caffra]